MRNFDKYLDHLQIPAGSGSIWIDPPGWAGLSVTRTMWCILFPELFEDVF